ncbi:hypothetical protein [Bradyrhizobium sp. cf659]|uniref:hypothetical protein n=1 Tax=Bradyrhizobium sp. cf659 TaxID=1761771 RepID=UPI0008E2E8CA|nr:hypothetical protein [Bradyrhizobium sp. cf659]SFJ53841.1 hypothetical protein SAMN04487925_108275 [Bradyrhizobium sp. cf659]
MNPRQDIYKASREGQDKYTYFLLAAAGAAIAFAVTQSQTATLSWSKLPLALAVLSWAFSFYAGCRQLRDVANVMSANYDMLRVQEGIHPQYPNHPQVLEIIEEAVRKLADKTGRWGVWQFRFLILGAVFYVLWHVTEMALRTPGLTVPYLGYS